SRKCTSCSRIGPLAPMVSELRSLGAGAPAPVVDPVEVLSRGLLMMELLCSVIDMRSSLPTPPVACQLIRWIASIALGCGKRANKKPGCPGFLFLHPARLLVPAL